MVNFLLWVCLQWVNLKQFQTNWVPFLRLLKVYIQNYHFPFSCPFFLLIGQNTNTEIVVILVLLLKNFQHSSNGQHITVVLSELNFPFFLLWWPERKSKKVVNIMVLIWQFRHNRIFAWKKFFSASRFCYTYYLLQRVQFPKILIWFVQTL